MRLALLAREVKLTRLTRSLVTNRRKIRVLSSDVTEHARLLPIKQLTNNSLPKLQKRHAGVSLSNGSQPDLVVVKEGPNGEKVTARTFNTETAEQLNSWMDGYEAQMRQMTDRNFGFYVHCILLIYEDFVERRIMKEKVKKRSREETEVEMVEL